MVVGLELPIGIVSGTMCPTFHRVSFVLAPFPALQQGVRGAQQAAAVHGDTMRAIKLGCRAGMGPCQARICGPSLQAMATGDGGRAMDRPVVQVPLKAVRAETILNAPEGC